MNAIRGIDTSLQALPLRTGKRIPASSFTVPKSPLRADGARTGGRDAAASLASPTDRVDLSGYVPVAGYVPSAETAPPAPGLAGQGRGKGDERESALGLGGSEAEDSRSSDGVEGGDGESDEDEKAGAGEATDAAGKPLDEAEQQQVKELKARDQEVRRHEQAHKSVGGQHAGAISYDYQQGPDGQRYAVGGEVSIDVSPEKDPAATITKMRQVRAAAMAPAEPSSQDNAVAAEASRREAEARQEMAQERAEESGGGSEAAPESGKEGPGEESSATPEGQTPNAVGAFVEPATGKSSSATKGSSDIYSVDPVSQAGAGGSYARLSSRPEASGIASRYSNRVSRRVDVYA